MLVYNVNQTVIDAIRYRGCILVTQSRTFAIGIENILSICENYIVIDNRSMFIPEIWDGIRGEIINNTSLMMYKINYIDQFGNVFGTIKPIEEKILQAINTHDRAKLLKTYGYTDIECQAITVAWNDIIHQAIFNSDHTKKCYNSSLTFVPDPIYQTIQDSPDPIKTTNPYTAVQDDMSHCNSEEEMLVYHNFPMREIQAIFDPQGLSQAAKSNIILEPDENGLYPYENAPDNTEVIAVEKDNIPKDPNFSPIAVIPIPVNISGKTYYSVLRQIVEVQQPPTIKKLPISK